jgi:hypothetical protein
MDHILVIGGSGILRGLCCHFAEQGKVVSVLARNKDRIVEIIAETQREPGLINPIVVDYTDIPALRHKLVEAVTYLGQPEMTITWMNQEAFLAHQAVADFLSDHAAGSKMFDLCCGRENSAGCGGLVSAHSFKVIYRRIVIGRPSGKDRSNRLTDEEICSGVLEAIGRDRAEFVIGEV